MEGRKTQFKECMHGPTSCTLILAALTKETKNDPGDFSAYTASFLKPGGASRGWR